MSETFRRTITPEIKIISEADGIVEYVASDETIDAQREIISAKGWRFDRFAKNAPFVDSHNYGSLSALLGRVISYEVKAGKLIERVKWAIDVPDSALAKLGFAMTVKGYLRAVSVGFQSLRSVWQGSPEFARTVQAMKLEAGAVVSLRGIHLEQDQLELSACVIGSNPNAVAKAFSEGAITESELSACGFGGDLELELLLKSGAAWEAADSLTQYKIKHELRSIQARAFNFGKASSESSSFTLGGGDDSKRQAEEQRKQFITALDAAITLP